jgi:hypothetical protein
MTGAVYIQVTEAEHDLAVKLAARAAEELGISPPRVAWLPNTAGVRGQVRGDDWSEIWLRPGQSGHQLLEAVAHEVRHVKQFHDAHELGVWLNHDQRELDAEAFAKRFAEELLEPDSQTEPLENTDMGLLDDLLSQFGPVDKTVEIPALPVPSAPVEVAPEPEPVPAMRPETARLIEGARRAYDAETAARADCCDHCLAARPIRPLELRIDQARLAGPVDRGWTVAELEEEQRLKALVADAEAALARVEARKPGPNGTYFDERYRQTLPIPMTPQAWQDYEGRFNAASKRVSAANTQLTGLALRVRDRQMAEVDAQIAARDEEHNRQLQESGQPRRDEGAELITIRGNPIPMLRGGGR